jgi:uncharacterized NAD(P)/FAD-binding protein YdhS
VGGGVDLGQNGDGEASNERDSDQREAMKRRRVAIVGAGFSGAVLAAQLMRRGRDAPDVTLIGRDKRFGPGLAYGTKDPAHVLNVRASNLSAFADRPDHFVRWLGGHGRSHNETRFVPRALYGRYVESVLRKAHGGLFGAKITRVHGDVTACRSSDSGWTLTLADGKEVAADAVVLALGNSMPAQPAVFAENNVPLIAPWDAEALRQIPKGDVLLLGTGLTSVDVALTLARMRRKGTIYALSRRGQLPRSHLHKAAPAPAGALDFPLPLSEALHALRAEVKAMAARGEPWQYAIDRLRARTPELWRRLPLDAQLRFLRHLRPWWDAHRHRAAPEVADRLAVLQRENRLRLLSGEIVAAEPIEHGFQVQHRQRGSMARHRLEVVAIVNCTGAASDPWLSAEPLVRQMLDHGLVRAPANGLGIDVDVDGRVLNASGAAQTELYALGPITQGAFWESTAVPEIRVRASALAMMLAPER